MFNFLKKKPIELHCLTSNPIVYECFKVKHAYHYYPEWWKSLPKYSDRERPVPLTMKGCNGFLDLYKESFVLPLWSDLRIELKNRIISYEEDKPKHDIEIFAGDEDNFRYDVHPVFQHAGFLDDKNEVILKFMNDWRFKCNEDINFMVSDCVYNRNSNAKFSSLNAIVSFKYQHSCHVFLKVEKRNLPMFLEADTPLIYFTPLTERPVKLVHHLITSEEHKNLDGLNFTFANKYYNLKKMIKKYEGI